MGVENCSTRCSSQAAMAGHRFLVRGETYAPVVVEPAVASDALGDQRLDDVVVGQQLRLAELGLQRGHRGSPW